MMCTETDCNELLTNHPPAMQIIPINHTMKATMPSMMMTIMTGTDTRRTEITRMVWTMPWTTGKMSMVRTGKNRRKGYL